MMNIIKIRGKIFFAVLLEEDISLNTLSPNAVIRKI
ncbi:hypothetical protein [African swine fever virus]|uniref:Hypthetical CDS protein n=1 Tax=African swine fever virus TaxID=10497 RepID=A0A485PZB7_ASF|nr:hypothetical protein IM014_gp185 [African swine fever virus]QGV56995.1 hypothetical protein [African swine fever virus]UID85863.1 hypothetical protein [African swine fever virus]UPH95610.1 hypothetical protein [African swine fever virus]UPH95805.1 hypothetical protein [African swine fever virus]UPT51824.1 hypothetical protein [African swine fever virus]